jgi:hypothetical protein
MPKSKTQAQKAEEREQRQKENAAKRAEEKRLRDLELQKNKQLDHVAPVKKVLNRRELRQLKKVDESSTSLTVENYDQLDDKPSVADELAEDLSENTSLVQSNDNKGETREAETEKALKTPAPAAAVAMPQDACLEMRITADSSFKKIMKITQERASQRAEGEAAEAAVAAAQHSRVVQNHSTYCEGLKPVLFRLAKLLTGCTITPGKISQVHAKCEIFTLEFQRATDKHTYQLAARNGHTVQDVLISVTDPEIYTKDVIQEKIEIAIDGKVVSEKAKSSSNEDICVSSFNREVQRAREGIWKKEHQQKDAYQKERDLEAKKEKKLKAQERKLASTKGVPADKITELAERDVAIISGQARTKNSMK